MLAMSLARRLTSDADPAPLDQHEIAFGREAPEAFEHGAQQLGLQPLVVARLGVA